MAMSAQTHAVLLSFLLVSAGGTASAQSDHHHHHGDEEQAVQRPVVFLDKNPRIVAYQLRRLDNTRLLLVERAATDAKYVPVYEAILKRPGIALQEREEAVTALSTLLKRSPSQVLLESIGALDADDRQQQQVSGQLTSMLLSQPIPDLQNDLAALESAAGQAEPLLSAAGFAGLMKLDQPELVEKLSARSAETSAASLRAVELLPTARLRNAQRKRVLGLLSDAQDPEVLKAAIQAVATTTESTRASFSAVAAFLEDSALRAPAVRAMLRLAGSDVDEALSRTVVNELVRNAEAASPEDRTTDAFVDEMQLADALLGKLPADEASALRERLRAVTVRIVRIRTVLEEMRYDVPYFAVEAGRPVQVILQNEDLMPHNMVITRSGQIQAIAEAGSAVGPEGGSSGLAYVPDSPDVLFATPLVDAGRRQRLTFTAPTEPGEYPYVCTFPRHWMRMYGVMLVVPDLDAWMQKPVIPQDPLGNTRSFVQNWTLAALEDRLSDPPPADPEAGARLFREATCAQCHKMDGVGGEVGPELTDVLKRWKGDRRGVLREMLEPSYRIEPKYTVQLIITAEGRTISGIVKAEDDDSISLLENPEAKTLTVVSRDDVDEIIPSTTSMMPKALLDKFTADEIMQILQYVCRNPNGGGDELCR